MKRILLLLVSLLLISSVAMADHIGVYSDATGQSCNLGASGQFNFNATVIHKFTAGATGSTFDIQLPPGTAFFGFNSPYIPVPVLQLPAGISLGYGQCRTGDIVLGTINAIYGSGAGRIVAASPNITPIFSTCDFMLIGATGGWFYAGTTGSCEEPLATDTSTWGSVKSLYR